MVMVHVAICPHQPGRAGCVASGRTSGHSPAFTVRAGRTYRSSRSGRAPSLINLKGPSQEGLEHVDKLVLAHQTGPLIQNRAFGVQ